MPSRKTSQDQLAEVARRRLELLSAELADLRPERSLGHRLDSPVDRPPEGRRDEPHDQPRDRPPSRPAAPADEPADPEPLTGSAGGTAAGRHAHRSVGLGGRLSGWVRDRLPPTLQGGAGVSVAHLAVVVTGLVAAVLATVWWVSSSDGGGSRALPEAAPASALVSVPPAVVESPSPGASPASPTAPSASAAQSPGSGVAGSASGSVVVDVAGKVRRPGIATLPLGSRVVDALEAAGGARRGVRLGSLNLARVLTDGEQVVVGVPAPPGVAASAASAPTGTSGVGGTAAGVPMVNINTAGQSELEELPGIGPVTAQAILAFRSERGTFSSVDELLEVSGIGDATLADLAPYVTL